MKTRQLERIAFLTRQFNPMQGLRTTVPYGLALLGQGMDGIDIVSRNAPLKVSICLAILCVVIRSPMFRSKAYYAERVGVVDPKPSLSVLSRVPVFSSTSAAASLHVLNIGVLRRHKIAIVLGLGALVIALSLVYPIWLFLAWGCYLSMIGGCAWVWSTSREHRLDQAHYLVAAIVVLFAVICCRAELELLVPTLYAWSRAMLVVGTLLIILGLIDHWQLMRAFGRIPTSSRVQEA